jgi:hypothetical protein
MLACGCSNLALLMDDISEDVPPACRKRFASLGQAHAMLLQKLTADLKGSHTTLWFCPTVYTEQFIKEKNGVSVYLGDLAAGIPDNVPVFWTGPRIVSKTITPGELLFITKLFKQNVIIWDNFYANDYCPAKLFLAPFTGRSRNALKKTSGIMLNPTGLFKTDCLYLSLMAAFLKGQSSKQAWSSTLKEYGVPAHFKTIRHFFGWPWELPANTRVTPAAAKQYLKAVTWLLWQWKSPLQCEWYAFLCAFADSLKLSQTPNKNALQSWIIKRYPPLLARLLLACKN